MPKTFTMPALAAAENKTCLACGKILKGRVDKKFCDDYCRNNYNNLQKAKEAKALMYATSTTRC